MDGVFQPEREKIEYPLREIVLRKPEKPLNLVILMAESWRGDMLNPEVMPATWSFAGKARLFLNHYSGGIATQPAWISLYCGIYGHYWQVFLDQQSSPLIMNRLKDQNYRFDIRSSGRMSYPELDRVIFSKVPEGSLTDAAGLKRTHNIEKDQQRGYYYDRLHVEAFINFVKNREKTDPFLELFSLKVPMRIILFPKRM